jgi:hypothetical protein
MRDPEGNESLQKEDAIDAFFDLADTTISRAGELATLEYAISPVPPTRGARPREEQLGCRGITWQSKKDLGATYCAMHGTLPYLS